jgi:phosphoribosylaminoimidazole (AIR) synthetase
MARTFNCGVGSTLIVSPDDKQPVLDMLSTACETAWCIGTVVEDDSGWYLTCQFSDIEWASFQIVVDHIVI